MSEGRLLPPDLRRCRVGGPRAASRSTDRPELWTQQVLAGATSRSRPLAQPKVNVETNWGRFWDDFDFGTTLGPICQRCADGHPTETNQVYRRVVCFLLAFVSRSSRGRMHSCSFHFKPSCLRGSFDTRSIFDEDGEVASTSCLWTRRFQVA